MSKRSRKKGVPRGSEWPVEASEIREAMERIMRLTDMCERLLAHAQAILVGQSVRSAMEVMPPRTPQKLEFDGVTFVSSWGVQCGISTYTSFLADAMNRFGSKVDVVPVKEGKVEKGYSSTNVTHIQHEFGIFPNPHVISLFQSPIKIITWHTVPTFEHEAVRFLDKAVDAHVVLSEAHVEHLKKNVVKEVFVIPHGCVKVPRISKKAARDRMGLPQSMKIGLVFGFNSPNKLYTDLLRATAIIAKERDDFMLLATAAPHILNKYDWYMKKCERLVRSLNLQKNVAFMRRYLSEEEVNLVASAADMFIFNYNYTSEWVSNSGAVHRILWAGRPIVGPDISQFGIFEDGVQMLKFEAGDMRGLVDRVLRLLDDEKLSRNIGRNARRYAERWSWKTVAEKHLEFYRGICGEGGAQV